MFCQKGSNFDNIFFVFIFLVDEGREDPNTVISWPIIGMTIAVDWDIKPQTKQKKKIYCEEGFGK